jgi:hypothetical protein
MRGAGWFRTRGDGADRWVLGGVLFAARHVRRWTVVRPSVRTFRTWACCHNGVNDGLVGARSLPVLGSMYLQFDHPVEFWQPPFSSNLHGSSLIN